MAMFDGATGFVAAKVMARMNAAAEREAVDLLALPPNARVLVIGFGPGIGIHALLERHIDVGVVGVDPSGVMVKAAAKLNGNAVKAGRLSLHQLGVTQLDVAHGPFDGAIAVNAIQMCEPFAQTAAHLRLLLRPGAHLVTITHDWAMAKHAGSVAAFVARLGEALTGAGFAQVESRQGNAEKGKAVIIEAW
jgi:arsenite methyltransferase